MSASEMEDLLDEVGAGLGCTPYLDGGAIDRAEAALSKLRAETERPKAVELALRGVIQEAWMVLGGEQEPCPACGTGGYGTLRDVLHDAEKLLRAEPAVTGTTSDPESASLRERLLEAEGALGCSWRPARPATRTI